MSVFRYDPANAKPWNKGYYHATLCEVETDPDRVTLVWDCVNPANNSTRKVRDIITDKATFKLQMLAYSLDLDTEFDTGEFDPDLHLTIGIGIWVELYPSKPGTNFMSIAKYSRRKPMIRPKRVPDGQMID